MTRVWQLADRYDSSRGSVRTWVFMFARSSLVDLLRCRRRVAPVVELRDHADDVDEFEALGAPYEFTAPGPGAEIVMKAGGPWALGEWTDDTAQAVGIAGSHGDRLDRSVAGGPAVAFRAARVS